MAFMKGLLFDVCGTLLVYGDMKNAWDNWLDTAYHHFKNSGFDCDRERFAHLCDGLFSRPQPPPSNDGLTYYERRLQAFCKDIGHNMTKTELSDTAMATVRSWADSMHPDPDCEAVLEKLSLRHKMAIISNFDHPPFIEMVVQQYHLGQYFAEIIISSQVGCAKPDKAIFDLALKKLNLPASETAHVGDSMNDDIQGARNAGVFPVLIQRTPETGEVQQDYVKDADQGKLQQYM
jgi:HAD superfamily hydrolase (TIGR01549 family)